MCVFPYTGRIYSLSRFCWWKDDEGYCAVVTASFITTASNQEKGTYSTRYL